MHPFDALGRLNRFHSDPINIPSHHCCDFTSFQSSMVKVTEGQSQLIKVTNKTSLYVKPQSINMCVAYAICKTQAQWLLSSV